ncbi:hypothetical protein, partial [Arthrobacter glacialis]|uniref:hypothetical protein n=1 Tax=Arthrobacter glacialis TaxID=1664 RepID=UPI0013FDD6FC
TYRHAKAIGGWGGAGVALEAAGVAADAPGIVHGYPGEVVEGIGQLLAHHRVWDRFAPK